MKAYNKPHIQRKIAGGSYKIIKVPQRESVVMIKE